MLDQAIAEFQTCLEIEPNSSELHFNIGTAFQQKGLLEDAISEYQQAVFLNPNFIKPYGYGFDGVVDAASS